MVRKKVTQENFVRAQKTDKAHHNAQDNKQNSGIVSEFFHSIKQHSFRYNLGIVCALMCVLCLFLPTPYGITSPGPTLNVLAKDSGNNTIITISGARTYNDAGQLRLVTVNAAGVPGDYVPVVYAMVQYFSATSAVLPVESVFGVQTDLREYSKKIKKQMSGSQSTAENVAVSYAKKLGVNTDKVKVKLHVDKIGGPSAGLMYTLGIIDKLTPQNETGGKIIAGTGTISANGVVGKIGGIQQKMVGARRDGATWFLAPSSNCSSVVGYIPNGLHVVSVDTLDDAYKAVVAIGKGQTADLKTCSVK
ncbi:MAG: S16 family serine protease [Bifidobacteriaceae bacterium]|nr:S16 family serine protease [Bifidobacteriaceae bacterium]